MMVYIYIYIERERESERERETGGWLVRNWGAHRRAFFVAPMYDGFMRVSYLPYSTLPASSVK